MLYALMLLASKDGHNQTKLPSRLYVDVSSVIIINSPVSMFGDSPAIKQGIRTTSPGSRADSIHSNRSF